MKVDLHVHACERSRCAISGEEDMIRQAIACGLDGLAFTDHHKLVPPARLAELNARYNPFIIYHGIEITADQEDWLVLGVADAASEREDWHYPELAAFAHRRGGLVILAHPFRYEPCVHVDLAACPPDGIEVRSNNTPLAREGEIRALAQQHHLALLNNSDAHRTSALGAYYNVLPAPLDGDAGLVASLTRMKPRLG
jgi:predicted metal-dependent phosphoesterase TrpH